MPRTFRTAFTATFAGLVFLAGLGPAQPAETQLVDQRGVKTPFAEQYPRLSPDGHWLAYASNESGRSEVLVQSFPEAGARTQISTSGGTEPVWSRDGRELFYLDGDAMRVVEVRTSPTFVTTSVPP